MAMDQDAGALERARRNLGGVEARCTLVQGSFAGMDAAAAGHGFTKVTGCCWISGFRRSAG